MALVPYQFLFRLVHPCLFHGNIPTVDEDRLLELDASHRLDNFAGLDDGKNFAEVYVAWNENGVALQVEVKGKERLPQGDLSRPRASDGITVWLDTRDARASHRASRYCHQFHFLPTGGGPERDEPAFAQTKINRALEDAPMAPANSVLYKVKSKAGGYLLEAFLPAIALHGFDPEQHQRLGFFYAVRDDELGEQTSSVAAEFPFWEDPSLWAGLELTRPSSTQRND